MPGFSNWPGACITAGGSIRPPRFALSHLTINYVSLPTVSNIVAPAGAVASAPAEDPLGFLAALLDNLLAGGENATSTAPTITAVAAAPVAAAEPIIPLSFASPSDGPTEPPSPAAHLLSRLGRQLSALQRQFDEKSPATPRQLAELGDTADAIAALLAPAPSPGPVSPAAAATTTVADARGPETIAEPADPASPQSDPIGRPLPQRETAVGQTIAMPAFPEQATSTEADLAPPLSPAPPRAPASTSHLTAMQPQFSDHSLVRLQDRPEIPPAIEALPRAMARALPATEALPEAHARPRSQFFAASEVQPPTPTPPQLPAAPLPALTALAGRLAETGRVVAPLAPEVAQKLADLAATLGAVATEPEGLASDPDRLETAARQLLAEQPAQHAPTTPRLAPPAGLDLPAPMGVTREKTTAVVPPVDKPVVAPATSPSVPTSVPRPALPRIDAAMLSDRPHVDTKVTTTDPAPVLTPASTEAEAPLPALPGTAAPSAAADAPARVVPAAYQAVHNPINMGQVAFEMVRQVHQGVSRFNIRLDPPELGRVDVKLHVDAAGTLTARLTVERAETLDMFQRDRAALERALGQTGLDAGKTNLEFSLRQNPFAGMGGGGDDRPSGGDSSSSRFARAGDRDEAAPTPTTTLYRGTASAGGVNILA